MFLGSRELVRRTGVYVIRNKRNGKQYVGSAAISFRERWAYHRRDLRSGRHHSRHLQSAFNKDGEESFEFSVVLVCAPHDCVMYEQMVMDHFKSANDKFGYNISPTAGSPLGVKHSAETRAKVTARQTGRPQSPETIAKRAASQIGRKYSAETLAKMSAAKKGRKHGPMTQEHKDKIAASNRNKPKSQAHRDSMSAAKQLKRLLKTQGASS